MNRFEAHIQLRNEAIRLTFAQVLCAAGEKYFVSAVGEKTQVSFEVRKGKSEWRMVPPVPAWLLPYEAVLAGILAKQEAGENDSPSSSASSPQ